MTDAAEHFNFEAAARLRDRIVAVRRVTEDQKVVWRSRIDMDLIALARAQGQACIQVFMVRGGKLIGQEHFILEGVTERGESEICPSFSSSSTPRVRAGRTPANERRVAPARRSRSARRATSRRRFR